MICVLITRLKALRSISRVFPVVPVCFLLMSCTGSHPLERNRTLVQTFTPCWKTMPEERTFPFVSQPYFQSRLSFKVSGYVYFSFQPGDYFRRGDTLAYIDQRDYKIACRKAEAVWRQKKGEFERAKILNGQGSISQSAYDMALSDFQVSEAAYEKALSDLEDTYLLAPFDGWVHEVLVQPYEEVSAGQEILVFVETDRLLLDAYLPEGLAGSIKQDLHACEARIIFDAFPEDTVYSREIKLNPALASQNLSYQLRVVVDNRNASFLPGMSGFLKLSGSYGEKEACVLPIKALRENHQGDTYVWIVVSDSVERVYRKDIGKYRLSHDSVWVESGLSRGMRVVVDGMNSLSEGMEVESVSVKE